MDSPCHLLLLGAFLLMASSSHTVWSLNCYDCSYSTLDTDTEMFKKALSELSDEQCLLREESDRNEAKQTECPQPESGNEVKCVVFNGTATGNILVDGVSVGTLQYHSVVRTCIEVAKGDSEYSDGCHDDLPSTAYRAFNSAFKTINMGDISFKGLACYSDNKNRFENTNGATNNNGGGLTGVVLLLMSLVVAYLGSK